MSETSSSIYPISFFALSCFYFILIPFVLVRAFAIPKRSSSSKKETQFSALRCLMTALCVGIILRVVGFVMCASMLASQSTTSFQLTDDPAQNTTSNSETTIPFQNATSTVDVISITDVT